MLCPSRVRSTGIAHRAMRSGGARGRRAAQHPNRTALRLHAPQHDSVQHSRCCGRRRERKAGVDAALLADAAL
jgi:hypothetical protein